MAINSDPADLQKWLVEYKALLLDIKPRWERLVELRKLIGMQVPADEEDNVSQPNPKATNNG